MQRYWEPERGAYRSWDEFSPAKKMPSQLLANRAILKRLNKQTPDSLFVALVVPAGFGKTELLSVLRIQCMLNDVAAQCMATTGVAVAQNVGSTIHSCLYLSSDNESRILNREAGKARL